MVESATPYTLAMIVCDSVHKDQATGKCTILGSFSSVSAKKFPAVHPSLAVYVAITDGRGKTPLRLCLVSVDEDDILFEGEVEVDFEDPRAVLELVFVVANIGFPKEGEYRFQLFSGTVPLLERRLVVLGLKERGKSE